MKKDIKLVELISEEMVQEYLYYDFPYNEYEISNVRIYALCDENSKLLVEFDIKTELFEHKKVKKYINWFEITNWMYNRYNLKMQFLIKEIQSLKRKVFFNC